MDEKKKFKQNGDKSSPAPQSDILKSWSMEQGLAQERARRQRERQLADWKKFRTDKS